MSNKAKGSFLARLFGNDFGAVSSALTTEQFNRAEAKAAELGSGKPETTEGAAGSGGVAPVAAVDPLHHVIDATAALGTPAPATPAAVTETAPITAAAFKAEQDRAIKAEGQVTALTTERDRYKAYFDKHNAQGKPVPAADATTTDQAKNRETGGQLSDASAQALEFFKGLKA